ncbi:hypothetical protein HYO65_gp053 [Tenacibaculum phage PTm1]|uniref:Uncharacterized protein n=2 Tax=Shirahamavirus PTm1 TaxID=2846435 RepID=A0A5S9BZA4_9CAUD|nr:hypothetical protein HYO65_gp053 [Tenacibaculum phage PTm1]BBI90445.1 hypothetical protein [Tenacibaculum phage PTm1]BBI90753.1 hypothetical protein [Tenacibaculum phage PTm5]
MDTKISNNTEVLELLKQREDLENRIKELDSTALINYELHKLGMDNEEPNEQGSVKFTILTNGILADLSSFDAGGETYFENVHKLLKYLAEDVLDRTQDVIKHHNVVGEKYILTFKLEKY